MATSGASTEAAAARQLGELLTATEAKEIADRIADGDTLSVALQAVASGRRPIVRSLLDATGLSLPHAVCVLRAIDGARSTITDLAPLWTMPGHLAGSGPLTGSVPHLVNGARHAVTCSTFNFQKSSSLWGALRRVAMRPEVAVRVYVDAHAAEHDPKPWTPTTCDVAAQLHPAVVMRTKQFGGSWVRNHAKFLAVDHRFLLVTSANFSWSAEHVARAL